MVQLTVSDTWLDGWKRSKLNSLHAAFTKIKSQDINCIRPSARNSVLNQMLHSFEIMWTTLTHTVLSPKAQIYRKMKIKFHAIIDEVIFKITANNQAFWHCNELDSADWSSVFVKQTFFNISQVEQLLCPSKKHTISDHESFH